jgi:ubiquinone/menaquinone biosynthesis C-methylase UbiE/uncharacterized protein YbaR (Trm112 family)
MYGDGAPMREDYVGQLRCPKCQAENAFDLIIRDRDEREVRDAQLHCKSCGLTTEVERGVPHLLHGAPEHVYREAAGLERHADQMRRDGWDRSRILGLPFGVQDGFWYVQAVSHYQILRDVNFEPGNSVLDVGANCCWASNSLAERQLKVTALDISLTEMQGLYTADWFFEEKGVFFERVLGSMFNMPLASNSFDFVYCCEVLHHNSPDELPIAFEEAHRVLKPGGQLIVINEPMKFPSNLKKTHAQDAAQWEGNENIYFFHEYKRCARRAGFKIKLLPPITHMFYRSDYPNPPRLAKSIQYVVQRSDVAANLLAALMFRLGGEVSLNMIGQKAA